MKSLLLFIATLLLTPAARPVELSISAPALERTLTHQLFNQPGPDGKLTRHYLRGTPTKGCPIYVDDPHITFRNPPTPIVPDLTAPASEARIVVTVHTHAKLGFGRSCFGITVSAESTVSFIPEAEGESIGFRDAHIEKLSNNKELDLLLEPFLSKKLPTEMKVNAANLLRTLLVRAPDSTGYTLTLDSLNLRSMHVESDHLHVDLDANIRVD